MAELGQSSCFGVEHNGHQPIESACIFHLTKLPLLTYPLIIEELRPEETPRGRFPFPPSRTRP